MKRDRATRAAGWRGQPARPSFARAIRGDVERGTRVFGFSQAARIEPVFAGVCIFPVGHQHPRVDGAGPRRRRRHRLALNEAILGLEWRRVGLILLVMLAVVVTSEAGSAVVRRRLA
jgi:hypothetical protein